MPKLKDVGLLAARGVLGSYMVAHGSQKLFGAFGGHGLEGTGQGFEMLGLSPGKPMAALAGVTELSGGVLTTTGALHPLGPMQVAGTMVVASAVHRKGGPFATDGGWELPFMDLTLAALLGCVGPGAIKLGPPLPRRLVGLAALGGTALAALSLAKLFRAEPAAADHAPPAQAEDSPQTQGLQSA